MSFGEFQHKPKNSHLSAMAEINVTPMVDVMLVLLVIFILAAPMILPMLPIELPKTSLPATAAAPAPVIHLGLDADGRIYWEKQPVDAARLDLMLASVAQKTNQQAEQPELQLRADRSTRYQAIADLMAAAQRHGLTKISFVTASDAQ